MVGLQQAKSQGHRSHAVAARDRVAIFYPWSWPLPSMPDVCSILAESGIDVDLFCAKGAAFVPSADHSTVVEVFAGLPAVMGGRTATPPAFLRGRGQRPYITVARALTRRSFLSRLRRRHGERPYRCVIGVDAVGVAEAEALAALLGVPFAYWSLEILSEADSMTPAERRQKSLEIEASRAASFVIVQDPWRERLLASENGLDESDFVHLPNAKRGAARRHSSGYLHRRLGIPADLRVVLYAGFLSPWALCGDILSSVRSWPATYALVLNSRRPLAQGSEGLDAPGEMSQRVFVVHDPVPDNRYRDLLDSASVGIALYSTAGLPAAYRENVRVIGHSSGKLADYLQAGLPVIVNSVPGPMDLVRRYSCGAVVEQVSEVPEALRMITAEYESMSENACRCFREQLDPTRGMGDLVHAILGLRALPNRGRRSCGRTRDGE